jgi:Ca2+-binding RTX toxin-like protein
MAWQIISTNFNGLLNLGTTDAAMLMAGVNIVNGGGDGVVMEGNSQQLYAYGSISSSVSGVYTSGTSLNAKIFIEPNSIVFGAVAGVTLAGRSNHVYNYGTVSGAVDGIKAIVVGSSDLSWITNYGTITATNNAISTDGSGTVFFDNFGTVTGHLNSYDASVGAVRDVIHNSGVMNGSIQLGLGNDSYTAEGAGKVKGSIFGGDGNDGFWVGSAAETIYGGAGAYDAVHLGSTASGAKVALDHAFVNSGSAAGDWYDGIENIYGGSGADYFRGNADANVLDGYAGADILDGQAGNDALYGGLDIDKLYGGIGNDDLSGGAGNDMIYGGAGNDYIVGEAGKDVLSGGAGSDTFVYYAAEDIGDTITDFANVTGNNDQFIIARNLVGFAAPRSLTAAELYIGTTNICTGAEDRIIIRTTDNTVWLDTNGNAAGGLTMLADLQAGVTLTAADFVFIDFF